MSIDIKAKSSAKRLDFNFIGWTTQNILEHFLLNLFLRLNYHFSIRVQKFHGHWLTSSTTSYAFSHIAAADYWLVQSLLFLKNLFQWIAHNFNFGLLIPKDLLNFFKLIVSFSKNILWNGRQSFLLVRTTTARRFITTITVVKWFTFFSLLAFIGLITLEPLIVLLVLYLYVTVLDDNHANTLHLTHSKEYVKIREKCSKDQTAVSGVQIEIIDHVSTLQSDKSIERDIEVPKSLFVIVKNSHPKERWSNHYGKDSKNYFCDLWCSHSNGSYNRVLLFCVLKIFYDWDPN